MEQWNLEENRRTSSNTSNSMHDSKCRIRTLTFPEKHERARSAHEQAGLRPEQRIHDFKFRHAAPNAQSGLRHSRRNTDAHDPHTKQAGLRPEQWMHDFKFRHATPNAQSGLRHSRRNTTAHDPHTKQAGLRPGQRTQRLTLHRTRSELTRTNRTKRPPPAIQRQ